MTLASMKEDFKALNTELLGLSVDSLYSHIAWIRKIEELEWNGMKNVKMNMLWIGSYVLKKADIWLSYIFF